MEFWFSELHSPHVKFDIRVEKQLFSGKSDYQRIDVFESPEFGKFLTLNGSVIFSEQDCFIYNEMVVHVPMCSMKLAIIPVQSENGDRKSVV